MLRTEPPAAGPTGRKRAVAEQLRRAACNFRNAKLHRRQQARLDREPRVAPAADPTRTSGHGRAVLVNACRLQSNVRYQKANTDCRVGDLATRASESVSSRATRALREPRLSHLKKSAPGTSSAGPKGAFGRSAQPGPLDPQGPPGPDRRLLPRAGQDSSALDSPGRGVKAVG
jgi:hypothetical protein